jgi:hypothetical protein
MTFRLYVNGRPDQIVDVVCDATTAGGRFECSGKLPSLPSGSVQLQLTTVVDGVESLRSSVLTVAASQTITAPTDVPDASGTSSSPISGLKPCAQTVAQVECYTSELIADGLRDVESMTFAGAGTVFFVEERSRVRVIRNDRLLDAPALTSSDTRGAIVSIAPDVDFARTHAVFVATAAADVDGATTLTILRYRELDNALGEGSSIATGLPFTNGRQTPMAVDADGLLYIAVPSGSSSRIAQPRDGASGDSGSVYRLTREGWVPPGNLNGSPLVADGLSSPTGLAVDARGRVWIAGNTSSSDSAVASFLVGRGERWPSRLDLTPGAIPGSPTATILAPRSESEPAVFLAAGHQLLRGTATAAGTWLLDRELARVAPTATIVSASSAPGGSWYMAVKEADDSVGIWRLTRQSAAASANSR